MTKYYYIIALLNPFLAFLMSIGKRAPRNAKWTMAIVFCVFFGLNFHPENTGLDSYVHYLNFLEYHEKGSYMFLEHWRGLKNGITDPELYVPITYYVLSRFTDSMGLFFAFHALVYALFFIGSLRILYQMVGARPRGIALVLFLFVIFLFPIHQINAVRWYTAMWAFIYCFLRYLNGDKQYLYLAFLPGLIHFSLFIPPVLLLLSRLIGYRPWILLVVFLASLFVPGLSSSMLVENRHSLGIESIEKRTVSYTNENYVNSRQDHLKELNWYVGLRYTLVNYFLIIIAVIYLWRNFNKLTDDREKIFYSFLFVWATLVNLTFDIPSFGGRMRFLLWILMASFFFWKHNKLHIKKGSILTYVGYSVIILYAIVDFRAYSANVSVNWLLGNPLLNLLPVEGVKLREVVFFWE